MPVNDASSTTASALPESAPESASYVEARAPSATASSRWSTASSAGRQLPQPISSGKELKASDVVASATYMERGQRWMEKEEVGSLRQAMDHMGLGSTDQSQDKDEEEQRLYNAALGEASELVWQHRNGGGREPDPHAPFRYKPHMRKNSYQHARAASVGKRTDSGSVAGSAEGTGRPSMESQHGSQRSRYSFNDGRERGPEAMAPSSSVGHGDAKRLPAIQGQRRASAKRNISGEVRQSFSGDQIWEEPETQAATSPSAEPPIQHATTPAPLADMPRNPQYPSQSALDKPGANPRPRSTVDIHRNPPSQSRNPQYTTNPPSSRSNSTEPVAKKNGMEIRGEDIRDATSMRLKDRSARLPQPSAVSHNPGRPIVSFDANWNPPEEAADQGSGSTRGDKPGEELYQKRGRSMDIPTIVVAGEDDAIQERPSQPAPPVIVVEESPPISSPSANIPLIVTPDDESATPKSNAETSRPRPLPVPGAASTRRAPAGRPRGHWSPAPGASSQTGTSCHECGYMIEGRFVALAGGSERFHPQCFSCYACGTGLEALEISPEPEAARNERIGRIRRRAQGEVLEELPGKGMAEDGDERLRFYCHLDWHELFAPKCKHCKTPILGEHIVALGEHWHYGHFFCAECGDPFEQGMTHIEKDGYAWCINCQTKRTERRAPKCKMCGIAVIGQYLQALGGEWHESCFRCAHCQGGFDDGQVFPKEEGGKMIVLCTACRMRDLKA
jgi:LIM domain-containing protein